MNLEGHKKLLFKSETKADWASRDSWMRRAVFWKYMAMGLEAKNRCTDKVFKECYEQALQADLWASPNLDAIETINKLAVPAFNTRNNAKIEIVKS